MRGRALFVTGTDTGVGKTWVSCQLLRGWRGRGLRAAGLKTVESGCRRTARGLEGEDDDALFESAGAWQPERCRYLFEPPVAPGVAAEDAGIPIDLAAIRQQVLTLTAVADRVLAEGAGGWLAPLGGDRTIETLAQALGVDVIVVGRAGLGTINHSALTARAVEGAGLRVAALILSVRPEDDRSFAERNRAEISRLVTAPVLLVGSAEDAAAAIDRLGL